MAKLTKHAEVLNQLHAIVTKKAAEEAQKSITGVPGADTNPSSIKDENENVNKNSIKPENTPQGYSQKGTDDSSEPVASPKTAAELGDEILSIIRKQAEAQDSITGKPGADTHPESISDSTEKVDKNAVKPEKLAPQSHSQKPSSDKSEPVSSAKKASDEVRDMAAKVASYELGRQFCAALLKVAAESGPSEAEMSKEAGRRDFDVLISAAADNLEKGATHSEQLSEKQAEEAGAAYFDDLVKQASHEQTQQENADLKAKVASYEAEFNKQWAAYNAAEKTAADQTAQVKLAETVANAVLARLQATPQE